MKKSVTSDVGQLTGESTPTYGPMMLRRDAIRPDPTQPRKTFPEGPLKELAASISDIGIQQRLIVRFVPARYRIEEPDLTHPNLWRVFDTQKPEETNEFFQENLAVMFAGGEAGLKPHYMLVAGERRLRAAEIAELDLVPVEVRKDLAAMDVFKIQHAENREREDLSPLEEGESFARAVAEGLFTAEGLAKELNMSKSHVYGRMKLAALPEGIKAAVRSGALNAALADLVAKLPGEKLQLKAMKEILDGGHGEYSNPGDPSDSIWEKQPMSVRAAKKHLFDNYTLDLSGATFDTKDDELLKGVGSCAKCPKRSGNCKELFPDLKNPNVCTDPTCFEKKKGAHIAQARAKVEAKGLEVLPAKEVKGLFRWGNEPLYLSDTPFAAGSETVQVGKEKKVVEKLLGKAMPKPVVAIAPDGSSHELYRKTDLKAALEAKGVKLAVKEESGQAANDRSEGEREAKYKAATAAVERSREKLVQGVLKLKGASFWRLVVDCFARSIPYYQADDAFRWLGGNPDNEEETHEALEKLLTKLKGEDELKEAAVCLMIAGGNVSRVGDFGEDVSQAADLCGVDLVKLTKEILKEQAKAAQQATSAAVAANVNAKGKPAGKGKKK